VFASLYTSLFHHQMVAPTFKKINTVNTHIHTHARTHTHTNNINIGWYRLHNMFTTALLFLLL